MRIAGPLDELPDTNLSLAVVSQLMEAGTLPLFQPPVPEGAHVCMDACDAVCEEWLDGLDSFDYRQDVADALLGLPVTEAQCATVRELKWHTSSKAIALVWSEWGGECEEFHIRALDGIGAALPGLEALHLELTEVTDLTPLTSCDRLRALTLAGGYDDETDLAPLAGTRMLTSLAMRSKRVEDLRPLSGLPLEHVSLDGCHDGNGHHVIDLAPLEHITSLRTLRYRRFARIRGDEHPALSAFGNARVIDSLAARGVDLSFDW
ncbi:hypothetical protein OG978_46290 (plasmid) [Streptomyces sp. NBC_01591]|uniref:DUF6892 domain-containing protein n=1 Tax=Streptomyces sp. NBC_01591 TaxID=2975888 RepID=UPI002DDABD6B|nr:hypothetical protein [Streptomyces sp. NBC_01591]WSD74441.1 hypothetical protein OG978_46290 [Streptomyces sp. NBC_01591]